MIISDQSQFHALCSKRSNTTSKRPRFYTENACSLHFFCPMAASFLSNDLEQDLHLSLLTWHLIRAAMFSFNCLSCLSGYNQDYKCYWSNWSINCCRARPALAALRVCDLNHWMKERLSSSLLLFTLVMSVDKDLQHPGKHETPFLLNGLLLGLETCGLDRFQNIF